MTSRNQAQFMNTPNSLAQRLLDEYWDLAFAEGAAGRTTDTPAGDAQRVRSALSAEIERLEAEVAAANLRTGAASKLALEAIDKASAVIARLAIRAQRGGGR